MGESMGLIAMMCFAGLALISYLLGCFNGAVLVSKYIFKDDVREHGSGNAGLTNFYRTYGGGWAAAVILCDAVKAIVAVLIGAWAFSSHGSPLLGEYWAAFWCLLGHMFPCMFQFKGGKGVLSGGAIALIVDWRIALVVWCGFLIFVLLTRYVSLGSVWAGASFPVATWFFYPEPPIVVLGFLCGGLVVWQHRSNIKRLLQGNENKLVFHKKHN